LASCDARRRHKSGTPPKLAFFDFDQTLSVRHVYSHYGTGGQVPEGGLPDEDKEDNWGSEDRQKALTAFLAKLKSAGVKVYIVTHGQSPLVLAVLAQMGYEVGTGKTFEKLYDRDAMDALKLATAVPSREPDVRRGLVSKRFALMDATSGLSPAFDGTNAVFVDDDGKNTADIKGKWAKITEITCSESGVTDTDFNKVYEALAIPLPTPAPTPSTPAPTMCSAVSALYPKLSLGSGETCNALTAETCNDDVDSCCWDATATPPKCATYETEAEYVETTYCGDIPKLKKVDGAAAPCTGKAEGVCFGTAAVGTCCFSRRFGCSKIVSFFV
jgi:hypothetical protein